MDIHVVRPGDTLYGIAVRYQADPAVLQELNGLSPDSVLAVGQTVVIRHVDTFHTVQSGQTLLCLEGQNEPFTIKGEAGVLMVACVREA